MNTGVAWVTAATGIQVDWYTGILLVTGIQVDWYTTGIQVDWYTGIL